jgi:ribosome-associated protein
MSRPAVPDEAIEERFVRAAGPGGQNVNKVASAVELRVALAALDLAEPARRRLARLAGRRLSAEGVLVIQAREHRTQEANRRAARARLEALVADALTPPRPRRATRPSLGSVERRLEGKARRASLKARRSARADSD